MGSRKIHVNRYQRSDGTIVASHPRTIKNFFGKIFANKHDKNLVDGLNSMAEEPQYVEIGSQKVPVIGSDFVATDLTFSYANLEGKKLTGLNLRNVDFFGAKLDGADFTGSDLRGANFKVSKSRSPINLTGALLNGSSWERSDVKMKADDTIDFEGTDLWDANIQFTETKVKNIQKAKKLYRTKIRSAEISNEDLSNSDLRKCEFINSSFKDCNLTNTKFGSVRDSSFTNMNLKGTSFHNRILIGKFSGSDLTETIFDNEQFFHCDFENANLSGANLSNINIIASSNFKKANLTGAIMDGVKFIFILTESETTDFTGANWQNAEVKNIKIEFGLNSNPEDPWKGTRDTRGPLTYNQTSFTEALTKFGLTPEQFEFLVVSQIIEVRDNTTKAIVESNFNPDEHHIPPWATHKTSKFLLNHENPTET